MTVNDERSAAEKDCDRILYSSSFRRLAGVTQVVAVGGELQLFHNRLTHTLKVAQIGRRLAEELSPASTVVARLGSDEFNRGDLAAAQKHLAEALRLRPDDYEVRMNYGTLLIRLDRTAEAAEQFSYAAKLRPQSAEPHVYAALVAAKAGRFGDAALDIQRAIAVDHDGSNRILIGAIRIPPRPTAIDEYLAFLRQQSGGH